MSAIKIDMSHFEFIFNFKRFKNSNLNPNLTAVPTPQLHQNWSPAISQS